MRSSIPSAQWASNVFHDAFILVLHPFAPKLCLEESRLAGDDHLYDLLRLVTAADGGVGALRILHSRAEVAVELDKECRSICIYDSRKLSQNYVEQ